MFGCSPTYSDSYIYIVILYKSLYDEFLEIFIYEKIYKKKISKKHILYSFI